ncbi:hypothetical protein FGM00_08350 [Aggregatimonas sangjinii]|uniref:Uncharacterized protein n=1 Tax=Aggregatimonas sangjinii TaxID=2583587 RepID=A0A5B7SSX2_9FLAO|nr:hypothetical protein [Aggregatimonas sangjinii]QCX00113.1 hypothetical protein FGM00_08350 [Aggregatimonas sangjinii]
MPNYFENRYNIITISEYFKNILSYQYSSHIEVCEKNYFIEIEKDYNKDFYCQMIDNDIEPRWGENLLDKLIDFNSPYDYMILDCENLESYIKLYNVFTWFILDFVYFLDMQEVDKFEFANSLIRYHKTDFVVKLKRVARNIREYPISKTEVDESFEYMEDYRYDGLNF